MLDYILCYKEAFILAVAFGFYSAGLLISYKTGSRYAFVAPVPPAKGQ